MAAVGRPRSDLSVNTSPLSSAHILIACGGTGGHLFPGIAVGEALASRGHRVTLLISEKKIDAIAASGHPGMRFEKMPFLAMPRLCSPRMPRFLLGLWRGIRACRRLIREEKVDAVLGMGGFTSFAPLYAGRREHRHTFIHESNAVPGKANRLNARYADTVLCGLAPCAGHFASHRDVRVIGTPVRAAMKESPTEDPHAFFKLDPRRKTLLVMGGSQGARGVNRAICLGLDALESMDLQVLHIAGPGDYEEVRDAYARHPLLSQHVAAFCHRMDLAWRVADLAIARSGASTMAELACFGVPSLLIPYPHAADDHQTRNAEVFAAAGAARLMPENDLNPERLSQAIREILLDPAREAAMREAVRAQDKPDCAERIADLMEAGLRR